MLGFLHRLTRVDYNPGQFAQLDTRRALIVVAVDVLAALLRLLPSTHFVYSLSLRIRFLLQLSLPPIFVG